MYFENKVILKLLVILFISYYRYFFVYYFYYRMECDDITCETIAA
jgi:hypothetical protein